MRKLSLSTPAAGKRALRIGTYNWLRLELLEDRLAPATVSVNATANVHPIDPNVYGTAFATTAQLNDLNIPLNRNGGNASDTYSYAAGRDQPRQRLVLREHRVGQRQRPGDGRLDQRDAGRRRAAEHHAQPVRLGREERGQFDPRQLPGERVRPAAVRRPVEHEPRATASAPTAPTSPATTRTSPTSPNSPAIEQAWIQHLITTFGNSQNGGVQYYTLGNEPGLWNHTHRDIHPNGNTLTELRDRVIAYASMVKSLDPNAEDPRASRSGAGRTTSSAARTRPPRTGARPTTG